MVFLQRARARFADTYARGYFPSTSVAGTKRRRSGWESLRRRNKRLKKQYGYLPCRYGGSGRRSKRSKRDYPMYRPLKMGFQQPVRMFCKHSLGIQLSIPVTQNGFSATAAKFFPLQGNDVMTGTAGTRPFPSNWEAYAKIYEKVRIHGIKITAVIDDMTNNSNASFTSNFYSLPGPNSGGEPADPYVVTTAVTVSQFNQLKGIRKNRMIGSGTNSSKRLGMHNGGYWSVKRIQAETSIDGHVAELILNADGTSQHDPEIKPKIIHKLVSNLVGGFGATDSYSCHYKITLYADWYARRRVFDGTFTEV